MLGYKTLCCRRKYRKLLQNLKLQQEKQIAQEEAEREHKRQQEQEARSASRPVPIPRKRAPPAKPCSVSEATLIEPPVPRPRSRLIELSPFDNPKPAITRDRRSASQAKDGEKKMMQRRKTLLWFRDTQAQKVITDGEYPPWLHGMISRREAENLLTEKHLGDFLIRISQNRTGYILSYKGQSHCRHYMIDVQSNGCYVIIGENIAHSTLNALVQYHQQTGIQPYGEMLGGPCNKVSKWKPDTEELKFLTRTLSLGDENAPSPRGSQSESSPLHSDYSSHEDFMRPLAEESRRHPHLYRSIRLAMREIQQASSQFTSNTDLSNKEHN
ncbi:Hypothetical predicted protein [Pelobates cultripes]|uniref:SH2 domain-containing protein n=1 Tax=Pelobates cultripes TaxID=61616 RepID=A0AAD1WCI5_PELCU|nr:Hypothetical predicted protein [Pelobates cultripes]